MLLLLLLLLLLLVLLVLSLFFFLFLLLCPKRCKETRHRCVQRAIPHQPAGPNYQTESEQKNRDCSPQKIIVMTSILFYQLCVSAKVPFGQKINFLPKNMPHFNFFFANPIPDPLMVGRGDGELGGRVVMAHLSKFAFSVLISGRTLGTIS